MLPWAVKYAATSAVGCVPEFATKYALKPKQSAINTK